MQSGEQITSASHTAPAETATMPYRQEAEAGEVEAQGEGRGVPSAGHTPVWLFVLSSAPRETEAAG